MPELLAIVEVPRDERVRCQAPGCNHPVFRRIHVVRDGEGVTVLGSECFKRQFSAQPIASAAPRYGSSEGRPLTDDERQLLIENTKRLVEQFEAEHQQELQRLAALAASRRQDQRFSSAPPAVATRVRPTPTAEERGRAEALAKEIVRKKYGVDPELPGWRGLVLVEIQHVLGQHAG